MLHGNEIVALRPLAVTAFRAGEYDQNRRTIVLRGLAVKQQIMGEMQWRWRGSGMDERYQQAQYEPDQFYIFSQDNDPLL